MLTLGVGYAVTQLVEVLLYTWLRYCCTLGWGTAVHLVEVLLYTWLRYCSALGWGTALHFVEVLLYTWLRYCSTLGWGTALHLVEVLLYKPDCRVGRFGFSTDLIRPHYGPGIDSSFKKNEHQGYLLWGKGGRCVGLTNLQPSCAAGSNLL
jgi:hypothetical protein